MRMLPLVQRSRVSKGPDRLGWCGVTQQPRADKQANALISTPTEPISRKSLVITRYTILKDLLSLKYRAFTDVAAS